MQGDLSMKLRIAFSFLFVFILVVDLNASGMMECPDGYALHKEERGTNYFNSTTVYTCRAKEKPVVTVAKPPKVSQSLCTNPGETTAHFCHPKENRHKDSDYVDTAKQIKSTKHYSKHNSKPRSVSAKSLPPKLEVKPSPLVAVPSDAVKPAGDSPFEVCVRGWYQQAENCGAKADDAVSKCELENSDNPELKSAKGLARKIKGDEINKRVGSGAATECGLIAILGNTASIGLDQFKNNCEEIHAECVDSCKSIKEAIQNGAIEKECSEKMSTAGRVAEELELREHIEKIKNTYNDGDDKCSNLATKEKNSVEETLNAVANATQAAKTCQCQLATTNQQGAVGSNFDPNQCAQSVPNPADCFPGASLAGSPACNIYANDDCTLGSGKFNSPVCQCALDNSLAICRTAAGKPTPSNFALDLNSTSASGFAGGGAGGDDSGDAGSMNLGGGYDIKKPNADLKNSETVGSDTGFARGAGSGGSGMSGGSGSGGNENSAAAGDGEDGSNKTGFAGLFNQVKSSVGDLFGKTKNGNSTSRNGSGKRNQNGSYDLDKWRPRGLASSGCQSSQVRCKNEDIFSIMSQRYDAKETTFIQSP